MLKPLSWFLSATTYYENIQNPPRWDLTCSSVLTPISLAHIETSISGHTLTPHGYHMWPGDQEWALKSQKTKIIKAVSISSLILKISY